MCTIPYPAFITFKLNQIQSISHFFLYLYSYQYLTFNTDYLNTNYITWFEMWMINISIIWWIDSVLVTRVNLWSSAATGWQFNVPNEVIVIQKHVRWSWHYHGRSYNSVKNFRLPTSGVFFSEAQDTKITRESEQVAPTLRRRSNFEMLYPSTIGTDLSIPSIAKLAKSNRSIVHWSLS